MGGLFDLILGGIASGLGGASAGRQQAQANQLSQEEIDLQKELQSYELGRAKNVFNPILDTKVLPAMMSRSSAPPFYASDALKVSKSMEQPWVLNY